MTWKEELEEIRRRHHGLLRPEDVLAFARNPKTALHRRFQWDDSKAAHQYRLWQARELIECHVVVLEAKTDPIRAYVSLRDDRRNRGGGYRHVVDVMTDASMRKRFLAEALDEAERWRARYAQLQELAPIFQEIAKARRRKKHVA
jgi:hypothetical protein